MLNKVYRNWLGKPPTNLYNLYSYDRVYRYGFEGTRFENWLFNQGFSVRQANGKRYLEFDGNEATLTLFLLKYVD